MNRRHTTALLAVLCCLPVGAADKKPAPAAPLVPPTEAQLEQAIGRGIQFLLHRQNDNGSWGAIGGNRPYEVYAPVPGAHHAFRAAVTSLCVAALIETGDQRAEVQQAIDRGEAWLLAHLPDLRRATPDVFYNTWGHAYAIQALVRLLDRHPGDEARRQQIRELIGQQIELLDRYEVVDGGWAYYDFVAQTKKPSGSSISFVTATVLVAFSEARDAGIAIPERLVQRGMDSMRRQRKPDFTYLYGEYLKDRPMREINRPGGSLGRSQACNLAMRRWGDAAVTDAVVRVWLDRLFARNGWLSIGRKRPIPHESWFQVAGYFFYYGHYYATLCIQLLPVDERAPFQDQLAALLIELQEKDGSWWDFPLYDYHQQYGTAFALMSLQRCRKSELQFSLTRQGGGEDVAGPRTPAVGPGE
jgi:hypothetical protein